MRKAFAALAVLLMLVVVAQFYFAASGAFGSATDEGSYRPHHALGYVVFLVSVALAVVGALARLSARLIGMAALVAALTAVQVAIAALAKALGDGSTAGQLVFGLHAVNAVAMLAVAGLIVRQARTLGVGAAASGDRPGGGGSTVDSVGQNARHGA
jgi:hypothetical protein